MSMRSSTIVGRDVELAAVARFLDDASGRPAALLIQGEAGIGKTTIWQAAVEASRSRGFQVLSARPVQAEAKLAFSALADLLSPVTEETMASLPEPQRHGLEVALLRAPAGEAPHDDRTIATGLLSVLTLLARTGPVLLALDDVQWVDAPSARVLQFAVRRLSDQSVGVLWSLRVPPGPSSAIDLDRTLAQHPFHRLDVGPLSLAVLRQLIEGRLGRAPPRPTLVRIARTARGNPFFALEIARALERSGESAAPPDLLPLPESLQELLLARVAALSAAGRRTALAAAALSNPTVQLLHSAVGPRTARAGLREAEEAGVIETEDGRIRFSHPLLASAAYGSALPRDRRRLHRKLAEVCTEVEERARHLALAAAGPDEHVAAMVQEAARAAWARGAPAGAVELYERALHLTPADRPEDRRRRAIRAAECRFEAGDTAGARDLLQRVVEETPAGPDRAEALRDLGSIHWHDDRFPPAIEALEQARAEAGGDPALRASIERDLAWVVLVCGDPLRAAEHARAGLEAAEALGDEGAVAECLAQVASVGFILGEGSHPEEMERALALERWDRRVPVEWRPSMMQAFILKTCDQLEASRALLERTHRWIVEHGDESSLPYVLFHLSELECWAGNWDLAARLAEDAQQMAIQTEQHGMRPATLYVEALVEALRGRLDRARALAEEGLALAEQTSVVPTILWNATVLGFVDLSAGDPAAVHRRLGPMAQFMAVVGVGEPGANRFIPDEVEALIALGELEQAEAILSPFEERGRSLGRRWALATSARCRGLLLAAMSDLPGALAALEAAIEHHEGLPLPFERGRTLFATGLVERRAKRWGPARTSLGAALQVFETLGARVWADRARQELARIGGRPPGPLELTATERKVAELIAQGFTGREAASALFLTERSVESNLAKVYRKLGIRSRAELGQRLAALREGSGPGD
jgi:tetratricopeptide (TPR) repeat protein